MSALKDHARRTARRACRPSKVEPPTHSQGTAVGWDEMVNLLDGMGECAVRLDGMRLYLPLPWRTRLASILGRPWMFSFWVDGCLRVMPGELWLPYRKHVAGECPDAKRFEELIVAPAQRVDSHGAFSRWPLPYTLAMRAGIQKGDECWVCAKSAWLEIWKPERKLKRDEEKSQEVMGQMRGSVKTHGFPDGGTHSVHSEARVRPGSSGAGSSSQKGT